MAVPRRSPETCDLKIKVLKLAGLESALSTPEISAIVNGGSFTKAASRDKLPQCRGVYVLCEPQSRAVLYIGKASGQGGLRGRLGKYLGNAGWLTSSPNQTREPVLRLAAARKAEAYYVETKGDDPTDATVLERYLQEWARRWTGFACVAYGWEASTDVMVSARNWAWGGSH